MPRSRVQYPLRYLLIAVVLVGLNLQGAIITSRHFPREVIVGPYGEGFGRTRSYTDSTGNRVISKLVPKGHPIELRDPVVEWVVRIERRPAPPTLIEIWAPVIGSVSLTLLVVLVPWRSLWTRRREVAMSGDPPHPRRWRRALCAGRWAVVGLAVVGLIVAGAKFRAPPTPQDVWRLGYQLPDILRNTIDQLNRNRVPIPASEGLYTTSSFVYGTIVYRLDGSILGYEGTPGDLRSRPRMIRQPTRSLLEIWWPVVGSVTISLLVAAVAMRHFWPRRSAVESVPAVQGADFEAE